MGAISFCTYAGVVISIENLKHQEYSMLKESSYPQVLFFSLGFFVLFKIVLIADQLPFAKDVFPNSVDNKIPLHGWLEKIR